MNNCDKTGVFFLVLSYALSKQKDATAKIDTANRISGILIKKVIVVKNKASKSSLLALILGKDLHEKLAIKLNIAKRLKKITRNWLID